MAAALTLIEQGQVPAKCFLMVRAFLNAPKRCNCCHCFSKASEILARHWSSFKLFKPLIFGAFFDLPICHRDADDAVHDLDGKDFEGGRVRVELAKDPRRGGGGGGGGGGGRFGDRDRGRRGNPPGPRTNYRVVVENVSSKTSWQVKIIF